NAASAASKLGYERNHSRDMLPWFWGLPGFGSSSTSLLAGAPPRGVGWDSASEGCSTCEGACAWTYRHGPAPTGCALSSEPARSAILTSCHTWRGNMPSVVFCRNEASGAGSVITTCCSEGVSTLTSCQGAASAASPGNAG